MSAPDAAERPTRALPTLDRDNRAFWTGGAEGKLLIYRCDACGRYQHPPLPRCPACGSDGIEPVPVSGRARVATFTINRQAWTPQLRAPFVFAAVELAEQAELYVFTNIVGCPVEDVRIGMPVEVLFEQQAEVFLPMFRPAPPETANG